MTTATQAPKEARVKDRTVEVPKEVESSEFATAVDWAVDESQEVCRICDFRPPFANNFKRSIATHIRSKHRDTIVELYQAKKFDLSELREDPPMEDGDDPLLHAAGIVQDAVPEQYNYLRVPRRITEDLERHGAVGRWVRKDELDFFKSQGAVLTQLNGDESGAKQNSSEGGVLRSNELTHVTMPHAMVRTRDAYKKSRINDQNQNRAEELTKNKSDHEKRSYDLLRQEGHDPQHASQVARALESRRVREAGG